MARREFSLFGVPLLRTLSKRQLRAGVLLFVAFLAAVRITDALPVAPAVIYPAAGIAVGGLFLEGVFLWPFVYAAAFVGYFLTGAPLLTLLLMPLAHSIAGIVGARILKRLEVDPILRRNRDVFSIIFVAVIISAITPTIGFFVHYLDMQFLGTSMSSVTWVSWWTGLVLSNLILVPFVLRWFAKPHFTRSFKRWMEIAAVLISIIVLTYFLFWTPYTTVGGISLAYALLLPFLWLALRPGHGPRFITLALLLFSSFALAGTVFGSAALAGGGVGDQVFQVEAFLALVAVVLLIIAAIEEERRLSLKLLNSQIGSLRVMLDTFAEKDVAKNEFIAVLAHELRNPVASVTNSVEILKIENADEGEKRTAISIIGDRMRTVGRLLEDLLDVSRIAERKLKVTKETLDLRTVVERAVSVTAHERDERRQKLSVSSSPPPLMVQADPVRAEQIIANLLSNASKYSGEGTEIVLAAHEENGMAVVSVKDQGIGINPEMIPHIFEPFRQIEHGAATKKGLGIGLALVKTLVEMHDGSISVKSSGPGTGAEFTVRLPLTDAAPTPVTTRSEAPIDAGCRVLVVDDEDAAAWSIGKLLELKGYEVSYAYDGTHALEQFFEFSPEAILMDIGLPDMTGYQAAKALRTAGYTGRLIALTGYSSEEDREKAKAAGFDYHLVKPVGMADLRRVLRS
jgi:signal transduction histidine kinase